MVKDNIKPMNLGSCGAGWFGQTMISQRIADRCIADAKVLEKATHVNLGLHGNSLRIGYICKTNSETRCYGVVDYSFLHDMLIPYNISEAANAMYDKRTEYSAKICTITEWEWTPKSIMPSIETKAWWCMYSLYLLRTDADINKHYRQRIQALGYDDSPLDQFKIVHLFGGGILINHVDTGESCTIQQFVECMLSASESGN